ncbi:MAG: aminodeoxychorismate synthase component I [Chitinophagales bacterium]|nr:aminodeoxychorismate synthase component I [Chitinophagales bacterium]
MNHPQVEKVPYWQKEMNRLGKAGIPFLFILDFELNKPKIIPLEDMEENVFFKLNEFQNYNREAAPRKQLIFKPTPITLDQYKKAFIEVQKEIQFGNSFLLNLTFPTPVKSNYTLKEIFNVAPARYKLYYKGQFTVFSPEIFVQIKDGKIRTFPMKGTIDADLPDAENTILQDKKESAEHYTITDLLRNDLSMVAHHVEVKRFRYIEKLQTQSKNLLQVSSEIEGTLPDGFQANLGDIFRILLPAGSISGAPKKKTVEIIQACEQDERSYYTGVFGVFDGTNLDSAVMIRFLEQRGEQLIYRSGCGITAMSDCEAEYQEMIDKVYVPIH